MDGPCLSLYTCKRCIVFKQFDGLNFDGLAGKHQKYQNFSPSKFCAIRYFIMTCVLRCRGECGMQCLAKCFTSLQPCKEFWLKKQFATFKKFIAKPLYKLIVFRLPCLLCVTVV